MQPLRDRRNARIVIRRPWSWSALYANTALPGYRRTCHKGEPLDAVEVGVLDRHDARIGEQLLGEVVDQLQRRYSGRSERYYM